MRDWRGYRQPLTVEDVGRIRFGLGIVLASCFAAACYYFFGGVRDGVGAIVFGPGLPGMRRTGGWDGQWLNPYQLGPGARYAQNLFAAGIAVAVAQGSAIRIWMTHRGWDERPRTRRRRLWSVTWAVMWGWVLGWLALKFGETYWLYVVLDSWVDGARVNELDLLRDYGWVLALLVVVVFLEQWKGVRMTYRCGKWVLAAVVLSAVSASLLALLQPLAS